MPTKRNVASAIRATRMGGKQLADLTGNPEDSNIRPKPRKSQQRIGELVKGFTDLGK